MDTAQMAPPMGTSRSEYLASALERSMREGGLAPGARLGTFEDIQRSSGLSRPTVSEALRLLRDRGVVEVRPGRAGGIYVADPGPVGRIRQAVAALPEDGQSLLEAIELHDHLELLIAMGAATAQTPKDAEDLRAMIAALGAAGEREEILRLTLGLHERIAAMSPNRMAATVYRATLGSITAAGASEILSSLDGDFAAARLAVHEALVEAVISGDAQRVRDAVQAHARVATSSCEAAEQPTSSSQRTA